MIDATRHCDRPTEQKKTIDGDETKFKLLHPLHQHILWIWARHNKIKKQSDATQKKYINYYGKSIVKNQLYTCCTRRIR